MYFPTGQRDPRHPGILDHGGGFDINAGRPTDFGLPLGCGVPAQRLLRGRDWLSMPGASSMSPPRKSA
eukprot:4049575-Amphidinium_carterae.1